MLFDRERTQTLHMVLIIWDGKLCPCEESEMRRLYFGDFRCQLLNSMQELNTTVK